MFTYIKESFEELKNNVTWLNREKASNLMVVVAVFSILFALATWGVDMFFADAIQGKLFDGSTYAEYGKSFGGIVRLVWYLVVAVAIFFGASSFFNSKK